jgi:predicted nucleotide-binding protein
LVTAEPIARALGKELIEAGFDFVFTGSKSLDALVGASAAEACVKMGDDPKDRIRTYPHGNAPSDGFGIVLKPLDKRWQEVRTFAVRESDAVVGLIGGKGTSDCLQKAVLAGKPVFPIAVAGGAAEAEWERLTQTGYSNRERGDLDPLADKTADPVAIARFVATQCQRFFAAGKRSFSRRVFVIHGHDQALKNEVARFLERLQFKPVILHEQPDKGRAILSKLRTELDDIGYAFALLTPDDLASPVSKPKPQTKRARQNVVFEHGMLIGLLGADRVCAIVKGNIEIPSDLSGVLFKSLGQCGSLDSIALDLVKELKAAGYEVDANRLSLEPDV